MDAPKCKMCGKAHYGTCLEPRFGGQSEKEGKARPRKKASKAVQRKPDTGPPLFASAVIHIPVNQDQVRKGTVPVGVEMSDIPTSGAVDEDAPRVMRPAEQLPLSDRITALEQIVDELLAGKKKRSEYMKIYMRDRRAGG